ncbi:hypothetical protein NC99_25580 [Sunxiuqinia dokdonensis]|uniref:Uncharacterized protein n=1 Tax=Sunxiuqinia dokdonensis TaxID=1409788 RepID=A0A0L8V873_9BACT|nr:hypothetical protein NC99_25580 [Sunxiuqinia dokdonensis]
MLEIRIDPSSLMRIERQTQNSELFVSAALKRRGGRVHKS